MSPKRLCDRLGEADADGSFRAAPECWWLYPRGASQNYSIRRNVQDVKRKEEAKAKKASRGSQLGLPYDRAER